MPKSPKPKHGSTKLIEIQWIIVVKIIVERMSEINITRIKGIEIEIDRIRVSKIIIKNDKINKWTTIWWNK